MSASIPPPPPPDPDHPPDPSRPATGADGGSPSPVPDAPGTPATRAGADPGPSPAPPAAGATATTTTAPGAAPAGRRSTVRSLLRLWPYVRPVRGRLFTAVVVAVLASSMALVMPIILRELVDGPVADRDPGGVLLGGLVLLFVGVVEALLFGLRRWLVARPLARVEADMRGDLYRHVQRLPVSFHDRWSSGQLLSRATGDLQQLRLFLAFPLTFLVVNTTTIVIGAALLLALHPPLALVVLAPVLPLIVVCTVFERYYSVAARRARDQIGDLTTVVEESILGIRIIKGFGRHRSQAAAFRELAGRLRDTEVRKARLLGLLMGVIFCVPELFMGAVVVLGVLQIASGAITAGTLLAFLTIALALRWPVESFGFLLAMSNEAATAADRYFEVRDARGPVDPGPDRTPPVRTDSPDDRPTGDGGTREGEAGLRFEKVVFRYPDAPAGAPPVLDGIDLHVRPGETMALVGATGCGKTTLTALVPRLHEPTAGRITLDGTDIMTLPRSEVRRRVAMAFEEPTLFSATVRENVLMGAHTAPDTEDPGRGDPARTGTHPGETDGPEGAADTELERALRIGQALDFVTALPLGAGTEVGEQGMSLSGGQRQRLALARAVVGRPRFLVLDDPLSALDVHTEARVEAALREVLSGTTALVVAHRPSTVQLADRVALMENGRVTAVGTHTELLASSAEYRRLMTGNAEPTGTSTRPDSEEVPAP
ncbi:ABC transporter ATP-binding protein [Streptomyces sp. ST2-7A]|uniref:ABC transporter ATP-binding protein n=1 Tax=Streptomyces sp. ST2-7A TaxID=2907214 RepID=UPI001F4177CC|nr:ABC transporter ATP-binding protein [Streptomyces sp. ST2-7A]MCE7080982.1 ABC transporter ATP-binding protein/permease [Streptomyces sp. ST2-7A]